MMLKKLQQKYARIKDEIAQWDELQSQLLSQFGNASSIIERLPVLSEDKNYGGLKFLPGIKEALLGKQMVTLERIFFDMKDTIYLFKSSVVSSLTCKCSAGEIAALRQLLTDQPNISKMEVQTIFEIIFAEDIR
ncbi:hypothetical protein HPP92_007217 [Vanilla planifolia]|uniref:Uncharacterized protein n=1 Tax=Vanilla planifolia TaxID=51239 RepID=A0A835RFT1_VANPL|nr:hypothetical protein HPP92_007217 [Vanilla planifolia]